VTGRDPGVEWARFEDKPLLVHERSVRHHGSFCGPPQHLTGFDVEYRTVPRALDPVLVKFPLIQRSSEVSTLRADGEQGASDVEHCDGLSFGVHLDSLSLGGRSEPPDQNPRRGSALHRYRMTSRLMRFPDSRLFLQPLSKVGWAPKLVVSGGRWTERIGTACRPGNGRRGCGTDSLPDNLQRER